MPFFKKRIKVKPETNANKQEAGETATKATAERSSKSDDQLENPQMTQLTIEDLNRDREPNSTSSSVAGVYGLASANNSERASPYGLAASFTQSEESKRDHIQNQTRGRG